MSTGGCTGTGRVEQVLPGGRAVVRISRVEACQECRSRSACHALGGQVADHLVEVDAPLEVHPGDRVRLALPESSVLAASVLVYALPTGGMLAGALLAVVLADLSPWPTDALALGASLAGLALGLVVLKVMDRRLGSRRRFRPRIAGVEE